jgi:hypothetical protein
MNHQASVHTSWLSQYQPQIDISISVQITQPADPFVDVSIGLFFEMRLASDFEDKLRQHIYDGVHAGLAYAPLSPGGMVVNIIDVQVLPSFNELIAGKQFERVCLLIESLTCQLVADLHRAMG